MATEVLQLLNDIADGDDALPSWGNQVSNYLELSAVEAARMWGAGIMLSTHYNLSIGSGLHINISTGLAIVGSAGKELWVPMRTIKDYTALANQTGKGLYLSKETDTDNLPKIYDASTAERHQIGAYDSGASTITTVYNAPSGRRNIFGGGSFGGSPRMIVNDFYLDNVPGTQAAAAINRFSFGALPTKWFGPCAGSIIGISVHSNEARTAGTLTAEARKNGSTTGLTAVLDGTNTTKKSTTQTGGITTFVAGDELEVWITTSGWTPTTADIRCALLLELNAF